MTQQAESNTKVRRRMRAIILPTFVPSAELRRGYLQLADTILIADSDM